MLCEHKRQTKYPMAKLTNEQYGLSDQHLIPSTTSLSTDAAPFTLRRMIATVQVVIAISPIPDSRISKENGHKRVGCINSGIVCVDKREL